MASLFAPEHSEVYKLVLEYGKTYSVKFTWDNEIDNEEKCYLSDCHECYNTETAERYIIYARDFDNTCKTFTSIILKNPETDREYPVEKIYFNDDLIFEYGRLLH